MSEIVKKRDGASLETLAMKINEEHRRCEQAFKVGLGHALKAGELLVEAKTLCVHGEWGRWLKDNFEGSERTAQAYMKVFRERGQLEEANPQRVADLSYREALKELSDPTESKKEVADDLEEMANLIHSLMDTLGPLVRDGEREAYESRLASPGPKEKTLLQGLEVSYMKQLAGQVGVDGFLLECADDGALQMTYRSADKTKIYTVPLPVDESKHADRLWRGCEQYSLGHFRMWRLLDNWLTEVVVSHPAESSVVTQRILRNADWRKAEPAAEYIYHKVFGDDDEHWFAKEGSVDLKEFREIVGGVRA
jgi:hypothetical protein